MIIYNIAYYQILDRPVIAHLGLLTLIGFIATAIIGYLNYHGNAIIPFKWHKRLAFTSVFLAIVHGLMGILIYYI